MKMLRVGQSGMTTNGKSYNQKFSITIVCRKCAVKILLIQIVIIAISSIVCLRTIMNINQSKISKLNNGIEITLPTIGESYESNCSVEWRKKHQIAIDNSTLFNLLNTNAKGTYAWDKTPKGTFTYWLNHIYFQNRIKDKAYFADKYLMKQYIHNYTKEYQQFDFINYAKIIFDFSGDHNGKLSDILIDLKNRYKGFVVKPNHFSGKQIIVSEEDTISDMFSKHILSESRWWLNHKYKTKSNKINREPWYELIKPHIFIEENFNVKYGNHLTEYKIHVLNYHALAINVFDSLNKKSKCNLYLLPTFTLSNVTWMRRHVNVLADKQLERLSNNNLQRMIQFSQHFAKREKLKYVRVDLYIIKNKIYFSEFTFASVSGVAVILPLSFDYLLYD
eukprot:108974_1